MRINLSTHARDRSTLKNKQCYYYYYDITIIITVIISSSISRIIAVVFYNDYTPTCAHLN